MPAPPKSPIRGRFSLFKKDNSRNEDGFCVMLSSGPCVARSSQGLAQGARHVCMISIYGWHTLADAEQGTLACFRMPARPWPTHTALQGTWSASTLSEVFSSLVSRACGPLRREPVPDRAARVGRAFLPWKADVSVGHLGMRFI